MIQVLSGSRRVGSRCRFCLNRPSAVYIAIISLSCEKSAYIVRLSGKDMGDASSVRFVCVLSRTGVSVRRARSSLIYPTPCTGPSRWPYLIINGQVDIRKVNLREKCTLSYNIYPDHYSIRTERILTGRKPRKIDFVGDSKPFQMHRGPLN